MTWTRFMDMHSGGGQKLDWAYIYIEAPEDEAKVIFYNRFGRSPDRVTCTCCGEDYSTAEDKTLEQATAYNRGCIWASPPPKEGEQFSRKGRYFENSADIPKGWKRSQLSRAGGTKEPQTLKDYISRGAREGGLVSGGKPLVIYAKDIAPKERKGTVPEEGYVWAGER